MALFNVNARKLGNGAIFVQYQQDGKAKDAAFSSWDEYVAWLKAEVDAEQSTENEAKLAGK